MFFNIFVFLQYADVKEQLKATKSKLKEEEKTLRTLNRDLTKSRTQAQRDKIKLKEAKRNGKFYQAKPYIPEELQGDVEAKIKAVKEAKAAKEREIKQKEEERKAAEKAAKEAAEIAKEANVKLLVLTHISTRYTSDLNIKNEAKEIFENTIVANDFTEINIGKDKTSINFKNILTVNND